MLKTEYHLPILREPLPISGKAQDVSQSDQEVKRICDTIYYYLTDTDPAKDFDRFLTAPQLGYNLNIAGILDKTGKVDIMINPRIKALANGRFPKLTGNTAYKIFSPSNELAEWVYTTGRAKCFFENWLDQNKYVMWEVLLSPVGELTAIDGYLNGCRTLAEVKTYSKERWEDAKRDLLPW